MNDSQKKIPKAGEPVSIDSEEKKFSYELSESELEKMLQMNIPELPPEDIVHEVTPWRKAIYRVLTGLVMNTITLSFLNLELFLPAIGWILIFLGFRTLRRENKWFLSCFIFSGLHLGYFMAQLIINATIYQFSYNSTWEAYFVAGLYNLSMLVFHFCFWQGFRAVQEKSAYKPQTDSALVLLVWYFVLYLLVTYQTGSELLAFLMVIAYIAIIRSMVKLVGQLEEIGYGIKTASIRISERVVVGCILGIAVVGIGCGYIFFRSYPMEWVVKEASMEEKTVSISEDLRDIGFPDDILSDLNAEDILACEGASQVIVETEEDQMGLKMTGIAVKVVENGSVWHIFHHFSWSGEYEFYGTEVLKLQPDWLLSDRFGMRYGKLSGRVLYERGDVTYTSPYYYMSEYDEAVGTTVWSMSAPSAYFAAFSFPNKGEGHRGYICYSVEPIVDDVPIPIIKNEFEYIHQNSQLQYPVVTAVEHCRYGVGDDSDYVTAEKWMQFGTENLQ